jgi:hypothetical protein
MELLTNLKNAQAAVDQYFDYIPVYPSMSMDHVANSYWSLCPQFTDGDISGGSVRYAARMEFFDEDRFIENQIYACPSVSKYVYYGENHILLMVDTGFEQGKILQIFDNDKRLDDHYQPNTKYEDYITTIL